MTDEERVEVVDRMCSTSCAGPYNLFLNATRSTKGCGMGRIFGFHHHHHRHYHQNETVATTTTTTTTTPEEEEEEPDVVAETQEAQQPMARRLRGGGGSSGSSSSDGGEEEEEEEDFDEYVVLLGGDVDREEVMEEEIDEDGSAIATTTATTTTTADTTTTTNGTTTTTTIRPHHKGGIVIRLNDDIINYQPARKWPGLLLGCMRDSKDGQYCSLKRGDLKHGDCQFFTSCCYGEMVAQMKKKRAEKMVPQVEEKCPGSSAFAAVRCSSLIKSHEK